MLTALAAPVVAPGVQTETVSWQAPENPSGTPTYTVTSSPEGRSCVTTTTSCLMSGINDATPWRYSVTYEIESDISELSLRSLRVPTKKIVVVAGQSNAAGIGAVAAVPGWFDYLQMTADPPADRSVKLAWNQPVDATQIVEGLDGPLGVLTTPQIRSWGVPGQQYCGPEIGAGRALYDAGSHNLVMFKSVFSGSLLVTAPGQTTLAPWDPSGRGFMFKKTINGVRRLEANLASQGFLAYVGAFIWYQGEFDTNPINAPLYQDALETLITQSRSLLQQSPLAVFAIIKEDMRPAYLFQRENSLCALLDCRARLAANRTVRSADDWAVANLPHVVAVDSRGSSMIGDSVHLDMKGEMNVGRLVGAAIAAASMP